MENPKIRIESDGEFAEVWLDGGKIKCTAIDFQGRHVSKGKNEICWVGTAFKQDENGRVIVTDEDEIEEEQFYHRNY